MPPKHLKRGRTQHPNAEAPAQKRAVTQPATPKASPGRMAPLLASPKPLPPRQPTIEDKCSVMVKALENAQGIPGPVLKMLCDMVPGSLGELQSQRHAHQNKVVEMIEKSLDGIERSMHKQIADAKLKIKEGDQEQAALDAAIAAAKQTLARRTEELMQQSQALKEASAEKQKCTDLLQEALTTQKEGDSVLTAAAEKKSKLQALVKEEIEPMKAGSMGAQEVARRTPALVDFLRDCSFDESMVPALPCVFAKEPGARTFFDGLVLARLDECIYEGVTALEKKVEEGEPGRCERAAAVTAARAEEASAIEKQKASATIVAGAQLEQQQAQSALDVKQRESRELMPELCKRAANLNDAQSRLDAWRKGPYATFKDLQAR